MRLALDHVIMAVPDLDQATDALQRVLGLRATRAAGTRGSGPRTPWSPWAAPTSSSVAVADEQAAAR